MVVVGGEDQGVRGDEGGEVAREGVEVDTGEQDGREGRYGVG